MPFAWCWQLFFLPCKHPVGVEKTSPKSPLGEFGDDILCLAPKETNVRIPLFILARPVCTIRLSHGPTKGLILGFSSMKRPLLFKFIIAWCFVALVIQASGLTRPAAAYRAAGETVPIFWSLLPMAALCFVIWQAVGLFRLKRLNCWIATVFFAGWALWILWHAVVLLANHPNRTFALRVSLIFIAVATLNLACAWYLSRRPFRELATQFRKERERELMLRIANKRVLNESRAK